MNNYFFISDGPDSFEPLMILELAKMIERDSNRCIRLKNKFRQEEIKLGFESVKTDKRLNNLKSEIKSLEKSIAFKNLVIYGYLLVKLLIIVVPVIVAVTRKIIRALTPVFLRCKNYLGKVITNTSQSIKLNTQIAYANLTAKLQDLAAKFKSPAQAPAYEDISEPLPPSYSAAIEVNWFKRQTLKASQLIDNYSLTLKHGSTKLLARFKNIFLWKSTKYENQESFGPSTSDVQVEGVNNKIYADLYQSPKVFPSMMVAPSAPDAPVDLAHNTNLEGKVDSASLDAALNSKESVAANHTDRVTPFDTYYKLPKQA